MKQVSVYLGASASLFRVLYGVLFTETLRAFSGGPGAPRAHEGVTENRLLDPFSRIFIARMLTDNFAKIKIICYFFLIFKRIHFFTLQRVSKAFLHSI